MKKVILSGLSAGFFILGALTVAQAEDAPATKHHERDAHRHGKVIHDVKVVCPNKTYVVSGVMHMTGNHVYLLRDPETQQIVKVSDVTCTLEKIVKTPPPEE